MLGVHGGALINKSILVGLGTYWSLSNTAINMGYSRLDGRVYRYMPHRLLHVGGSLLVGYGGQMLPIEILVLISTHWAL